MSSGLTLTKDGEELETSAVVDYNLSVTGTKTDLVVLAQFNEPGNYDVFGDIRNQSYDGLSPTAQKKAKAGVNLAADLLLNPTIVQPHLATMPVTVPPGPSFFQPPPMMQPCFTNMPPPPDPFFFQQSPMMMPPAPPKVFYPPPFQS